MPHMDCTDDLIQSMGSALKAKSGELKIDWVFDVILSLAILQVRFESYLAQFSVIWTTYL